MEFGHSYSHVPAFCASSVIASVKVVPQHAKPLHSTPLDHPPLHSIIPLPQATDDALLEAALLIKRALS